MSILIIKILNYTHIKENKRNINKKHNLKIGYLDIIYLIKMIIILNLNHQTKTKDIILKDSIIYLKVKGINEKYILSSRFESNINKYLKKVYINEKLQITNSYKYCFNQTDNFVKLIWDDSLNNCNFMFLSCASITEINLSNFKTSQVTSMEQMFLGCSLLTSLDLSNFDTSQVTNMNGMFISCSSLTSLDLSFFNTQKVENMELMFFQCSSLTSLNLSNFDVSKVTTMNYMFTYCEYLEYINLYNFDEIRLKSYNEMFKDVPINVVICLKENINGNDIPQIAALSCHVIDCSKDWKLKQKKIISNSQTCIESCYKSEQYKYEYNGKCLKNCPNGNLHDDNNNILNICKCELDQCLTCPNVVIKKKLCTKCNDNYYSKQNDPSNLGEYINCYNQTNEEENPKEDAIENYDIILKIIEQEITSDGFDTTDLDNGKDRITEKEKLKIII